MDNALAPVVLFVYNRPEHTLRTLEALAKNELAGQSPLYIYADGPKKDATAEQCEKIAGVREVIKQKSWCGKVEIIESAENKGLADSVIKGVTEVVEKHGKVIVLEDDLITATGFLKFMNDALNRYEANPEVMQVSGFMFPIAAKPSNNAFFLPLTTSWGWATWKRAWQHFDPLATGYEKLKTDQILSSQFDLDGSYPYTRMLLMQMEEKSISSWAIRWWWSVFKNKGLTLFPDSSLVENIGFGIDATHTNGTNPYGTKNFSENHFVLAFPSVVETDMVNFKNLKFYLRPKKFSKSNSKISIYSFCRKTVKYFLRIHRYNQ